MTTPTREQLEADIVATREDLSRTVESLGHKLDVKGRARDGASAAAGRLKGRVKDRPALPMGLVIAAVAVGAAAVLWRRRR